MIWQPQTETVALIANGDIVDPITTSKLVKEYGTPIAVDGGLSWCEKMGITPSLIIGDLDSAVPTLLHKYKNIPKIHDSNQNTTDLEKALNFLAPFNLKKIVVFAGLGKRIDHMLTNMLLLSRFPDRVVFVTEKEELFVMGKEVTIECIPGQIVSLIPLNGQVTGIYSKGLKWELSDATLSKNFIGISNIALRKSVEIRYATGDLLLCINKGQSLNSR